MLYFPGNPDTRAQAQTFETTLKAAGVQVKAFGKRDSNHSALNNDLGKPDDPATLELYKFIDPLVGK
ncbi:MAG: arylformamidase [Verrucomicrobiales bacterium]